jgi:hypothetical protein
MLFESRKALPSEAQTAEDTHQPQEALPAEKRHKRVFGEKSLVVRYFPTESAFITGVEQVEPVKRATRGRKAALRYSLALPTGFRHIR